MSCSAFLNFQAWEVLAIRQALISTRPLVDVREILTSPPLAKGAQKLACLIQQLLVGYSSAPRPPQ